MRAMPATFCIIRAGYAALFRMALDTELINQLVGAFAVVGGRCCVLVSHQYVSVIGEVRKVYIVGSGVEGIKRSLVNSAYRSGVSY